MVATVKYSKFNPLDEILRIQVPTDLCVKLISRFQQFVFPKILENDDSKFLVVKVDKNESLMHYISRVFPAFEIFQVRIHRFDNARNGMDTIIVRLNVGDNRLKVDGVSIAEGIGWGVCLPSGTFHEVTTGNDIRYSLVIWGKWLNEQNKT